jgi:hypothetical protein
VGSTPPGRSTSARTPRARGKPSTSACAATSSAAKAARLLANFQLKEHERFHNHKLRHDLVELIGPTNTLIVLRDVETDLAEGTPLENQHDNHVHEAYRG